MPFLSGPDYHYTKVVLCVTGKTHKKGFPFEYYVEVIPKNIKQKLESRFLNHSATKIQQWWKKINTQ